MWGQGRDPKYHMNIRILDLGSKTQARGIPETKVCGILRFMWSFGLS